MNGTNFSWAWNLDVHENLPIGAYYVFGCIYIMFSLIAIVGNSVTIYVFICSQKLRSANYYLVFALCFGDLLMSFVGLSMLIINSFATYWILGDTACAVYATLMTFLGLSHITLLAIIAFVRYKCVVHNSQTTPLVAKISVLLCYSCSLCLATAPNFGWSKYVKEPIETSCGPNWKGKEPLDASFIITLFCTCFLIPLCIILFCYTRIYRKINNTNRMNKNREIYVSITIFLMIVTFLGVWTPYACIALYMSITNSNRINMICFAIALVLAKSAPIWNPYIYFVRDIQFNDECQKFIPFLTKHGFCRVRPRNRDVALQLQSTVIRSCTTTYV